MSNKYNNIINLVETPEPVAPSSGVQSIYAKVNGNLYHKNTSGQEYLLGNFGQDTVSVLNTPYTIPYNVGTVLLAASSSVINLPSPALFTNREIAIVNKTQVIKTTDLSFTTSLNISTTEIYPGESIIIRSNGTTWDAVSNSSPRIRYIPLLANFTTTSNVRSNVTNWNFIATAGKHYRIEVIGKATSTATTTGFSLGFITAGTGTITGNVKIALTNVSAATAVEGTISAISSINTLVNSFLTSGNVSATATPIHLKADVIYVTTTGGQISVQFGSEVNGSSVSLLVGSAIIITELF
jgi:hypothetical protein